MEKDGKSTAHLDKKIAELQKQIDAKPSTDAKDKAIAKLTTNPGTGLPSALLERYAKDPKSLKSKISSMKKYIATRDKMAKKAPQQYIDRLAQLEALLAEIENN